MKGAGVLRCCGAEVLTCLGAVVLAIGAAVRGSHGLAQATADGDRVMTAVRAALAPALPFPDTDDSGSVASQRTRRSPCGWCAHCSPANAPSR